MGRLIFPADKILELIAITNAGDEHRTNLEFYQAKYLKVGATVTQADLDHFEGGNQLDPKKIPPHLVLVHDDGVYLMSSALIQPTDENDRAAVVHAAGANPNVDEDSWNNAREMVGGDDFAIPLTDLAGLTAIINGGRATDGEIVTLELEFSEEEIYMATGSAPEAIFTDGLAAVNHLWGDNPPKPPVRLVSPHVYSFDPASGEVLDIHAAIDCPRNEPLSGETVNLEPGVRFFVRALEALGCTTRFSCEGHPGGWYVLFRGNYETAVRIQRCGFLTVELSGQQNEFVLRLRQVESPANGQQVLRWAARAWASAFPEVANHPEIAGRAP